MDLTTIQPRRKALRIKQQILADEAGVSLNTLACIECGLNDNPTLRTWRRIDAALARLEAKAQEPIVTAPVPKKTRKSLQQSQQKNLASAPK